MKYIILLILLIGCREVIEPEYKTIETPSTVTLTITTAPNFLPCELMKDDEQCIGIKWLYQNQKYEFTVKPGEVYIGVKDGIVYYRVNVLYYNTAVTW